MNIFSIYYLFVSLDFYAWPQECEGDNQPPIDLLENTKTKQYTTNFVFENQNQQYNFYKYEDIVDLTGNLLNTRII